MMISRFRIHCTRTLFALLAVISLWGCSKEYSRESPVTDPVEQPAEMAAYALEHQGGSCSDAVVTGAFKVGTPVAAGAKIQVTVQVAMPGAWILTTGNVNGMEFTGGGTFTATGKYTITLMGRGTPQQEGSFIFPLKTSGSSCGVTVKVAGDGPEIPTPPADFYYKMTANGKDYVQEVTAASQYTLVSQSTGGTDVLLGTGISWAGSASLPPGKTEMIIAKGMLANFDAASDQQFKSFFQPGNYNYMIMNNQTFGNGMLLSWTDEKGVAWTSLNGTTGQPTGIFTIVSTEDWSGYPGYYGVKVKMTFTCKLYNEAGGELTITNGEMVGGFLKKR